jgi:Phage derived protein Gp49-like (DUF891)
MEPFIAYRGIRFTIEYAIRCDGSVPALDFFNVIEARWQARLIVLFKLLGDTGQIRNQEQFRKFMEGFFEFKAFQVRMPCYFRPDKRVVITHGFTKKKEGQPPKQEVERAVRIRVEYEERLASETKSRR